MKNVIKSGYKTKYYKINAIEVNDDGNVNLLFEINNCNQYKFAINNLQFHPSYSYNKHKLILAIIDNVTGEIVNNKKNSHIYDEYMGRIDNIIHQIIIIHII